MNMGFAGIIWKRLKKKLDLRLDFDVLNYFLFFLLTLKLCHNLYLHMYIWKEVLNYYEYFFLRGTDGIEGRS